MKKAKRALLMVLCALLLCVASVFGTLAYLTSQDTVTNTFTVGNVKITMDETKVDEYGRAVYENECVQANQYKLMPGHEYTKNPTIHVDPNSEECYLFIKVENGIADIEAKTSQENNYRNIEDQLATMLWEKVEGTENVYYSNATAQADKSYNIFNYFRIDSALADTDLAAYADAEIVITAYAIQADGFASWEDAWDALNDQLGIVTP